LANDLTDVPQLIEIAANPADTDGNRGIQARNPDIRGMHRPIPYDRIDPVQLPG
jgi:hypothetical protein